jgi:hypothetical protein
MLHSALFVAAVPDNKQVWQNFIDAVDGKAALRPQAIVRLAENIWLLLVRETPAPLGWLVSYAELHKIRYGILPFEREPEWLPAGFDPKTILAQND